MMKQWDPYITLFKWRLMVSMLGIPSWIMPPLFAGVSPSLQHTCWVLSRMRDQDWACILIDIHHDSIEFTSYVLRFKYHSFVPQGFIGLLGSYWRGCIGSTFTIYELEFGIMECEGQFTWGPKSQAPLILAIPNMEVKSQLVSIEKP